MSAPDIGAQFNLTRQTVHRLLHQLESIGIVRRDIERDRFEVAPALTELGLLALTGNHTARLRHAVLESLVDSVQETCNFAVLDGYEVVYIDRVECNWPLRRRVDIGSRMPAYCTASGKLLLANLPKKTLDQYLSVVKLEKFTENTWTDPEHFREHLADIRLQGYAINRGEDLLGLLGVAVPVCDPSGRMPAAIAIHAPEFRLPESRAIEILPEMTKAANALGDLLLETISGGSRAHKGPFCD